MEHAYNIIIAVVVGLAILIGALRYYPWQREQTQLDDGPTFGNMHNWEVRVVHDVNAGTDHVGIVVTTTDVDGIATRHYLFLAPGQARTLASWLRGAPRPG